MAGKKGMKHYSLEFRRKVVSEYLEKRRSRSELCLAYDLNRTQIQTWTRWQREFGEPKKPPSKKPRGRPRRGKETDKEKIARLEMENTLLKKFHELLREEHKRK